MSHKSCQWIQTDYRADDVLLGVIDSVMEYMYTCVERMMIMRFMCLYKRK